MSKSKKKEKRDEKVRVGLTCIKTDSEEGRAALISDLLAQIAIRGNEAVVIFLPQGKRDRLMTGLLAMRANIPLSDMYKELSKKARSALTTAAAEYVKAPLYFGGTSQNFSVSRAETRLRKLEADLKRKKLRMGMIMLCGLRVRLDSAMTRSIKKLSEKFGVRVVSLN